MQSLLNGLSLNRAPFTGGSVEPDFHLSASWRTLFRSAGYCTFDHLWNLPKNFVEAVNIRRGGWSAVSILTLSYLDRVEIFYIKRQENQRRRSLACPSGKLTFLYEAQAILRNRELQLPSVEIVGLGHRKTGNDRQAILITRRLNSCSLAELLTEDPQQRNLLPALEEAGRRVLAMHEQKISHGALYPNHLYLDLRNNRIHLIDFERSRVCLSRKEAIRKDITQFLKRAGNLRADEISSFLKHHKAAYPRLIAPIVKKYHVS